MNFLLIWQDGHLQWKLSGFAEEIKNCLCFTHWSLSQTLFIVSPLLVSEICKSRDPVYLVLCQTSGASPRAWGKLSRCLIFIYGKKKCKSWLQRAVGAANARLLEETREHQWEILSGCKQALSLLLARKGRAPTLSTPGASQKRESRHARPLALHACTCSILMGTCKGSTLKHSTHKQTSCAVR